MGKQKQAAFMAAYAPCHDAFIRYCTAVAYGKMDVEDLVQDVLLAAYEHFDNIIKKDQLLHYLIKVARNKIATRWRKSRYKTELLDPHKEHLLAQGALPEMLIDIQILYQALSQLPEKQRDAIVLFEISGFSMKEIAQLQNSQENAVKTRISRGRKRLRALMEEEQSTPASSKTSSIIPVYLAVEQGDKSALLFEYIRQLPISFSKETIFHIIEKLPALVPLTMGWLYHINLNTIMMGVISIAILIGGLAISGAKESNSSTTTTPPMRTEEHTYELLSENPKRPESMQISLHMNAVADKKKEAVPALQMAAIPLKPLLVERNNDTKHINIGRAGVNNIDNPISMEAEKINADCNNRVNFKGDIEDFKRTLLQALVNDHIITTQTKKVRLSFTDNKIVVNKALIPKSLQQKYNEMLLSYDIHACPARIVEITNHYIAVGDITKDGFRGRVHGNVELEVLNNINIKELQITNEINKQVEERAIGAFHTLKVSGLAVVHLSKGATKTATVEVSGMPMEDLITEEKNGVLTVTTRGQHSGEQIRVLVSAPTLKSIEVGGAAELYSKETIQAEALDISVVDVGAAWLDVDVDKINIHMKGGDLTITGTADEQYIHALGKDGERGTLNHKNLKSNKQ